MPSAPLAVKTVTGNQAGATDAPDPGPLPRRVPALPRWPHVPALPRWRGVPGLPGWRGVRGLLGGRGLTALLRWPRVSGASRRAPRPSRDYHDPLFERPDLVEDDYYRFRHYPRG